MDSNRAMLQIQMSNLLMVVPNFTFPPTPIKTRPFKLVPMPPTKARAEKLKNLQLQKMFHLMNLPLSR